MLPTLESFLAQSTEGWTDAYITKKGLDPTYLRPILSSKAHTLVASCAGSGKTTALSLKILYDLDQYPRSRAWVGTFLRSGAGDLTERLNEVQREAGLSVRNYTTSTIHAEFLRVATQLLGYRPELIEESADRTLLRKVLLAHQIDVDLLDDFFTYLNAYVNSLGVAVIPTNLQRFSSKIDTLNADWKTLRMASGQLNHNDIQDYLIGRIRGEKEIQNYLGSQYDLIYIDEFQDVSLAQYFILKAYLSQDTRIVVVGDDDQTIYSWRGSDVRVIQKYFVEDFSPVVLELPVNYRCPQTILDVSLPLITSLSGRLPKDMRSSALGGEVHLSHGSIPALVNRLSRGVDEDIARGNSVAILFRTNQDGLLPAISTAMSLHTFRTSPGITRNNNLTRSALGIFNLFVPSPGSVSGAESSIISVFRTLLGVPKNEIQSILGYANHQGISLYDAFYRASDKDIQHSCKSLFPFITELTLNEYAPDKVGTLATVLYELLPRIRSNTTNRQQLVAAMTALVNYSTQAGYESPLVARQKMVYFIERLAQSSAIDSPQVILSTVHDFKGKEADSVYIWNFSQGSFPHVLASSPTELYEEVRVAYISLTRAKKKMTLLVSDITPSEFLNRMSLPTTLTEFKGKL